MMEEYIVKEGKRLRLGYTTGSCAAAAAKAAAWMLLTGQPRERIGLITPKGIRLELEVTDIAIEPDRVSCAVIKDGGDDPDITTGAHITATVVRTSRPGVEILGGPGVGRVTKPGLDQPVGAAAINSVPRRMIRENVEEICRLLDEPGGLTVTISVPGGGELAKKTFNPRLGIEGGISILGTTGMVEPMSDQALIDTIRVELRQRRATGAEYALLTPGNYGADFLRDGLGVDPSKVVQTSNFIGDSLDLCRELGFRGAVLVGHVGKLVKLSGGMLNTHSKYGDCRMPLLTAQAAACGISPGAAQAMLSAVTCDEAIRIAREAGVMEPMLKRVTALAWEHLARRAGELSIGLIIFSKIYGVLGQSENAQALLQHFQEG